MVIKTISTLFIFYFIFSFFLTKRFRAHKNTSHLEVHARVKNCCLCCLVLAYFCFVYWFILVTCFCVPKIFSSEKNKQTWYCLDNLNLLYYWGVPLSSHLSKIQLCALNFICDHLWKSLLFMKVFLNLFLFMIICENVVFKSLWK